MRTSYRIILTALVVQVTSTESIDVVSSFQEFSVTNKSIHTWAVGIPSLNITFDSIPPIKNNGAYSLKEVDASGNDVCTCSFSLVPWENATTCLLSNSENCNVTCDIMDGIGRVLYQLIVDSSKNLTTVELSDITSASIVGKANISLETCPVQPNTEHTVLTGSCTTNYNYFGCTSLFNCSEEYSSDEGDAVATCQADAAWNTILQCEIITCEVNPCNGCCDNDDVPLNNKTMSYGNETVVTCCSGFYDNGSATYTCENGSPFNPGLVCVATTTVPETTTAETTDATQTSTTSEYTSVETTPGSVTYTSVSTDSVSVNVTVTDASNTSDSNSNIGTGNVTDVGGPTDSTVTDSPQDNEGTTNGTNRLLPADQFAIGVGVSVFCVTAIGTLGLNLGLGYALGPPTIGLYIGSFVVALTGVIMAGAGGDSAELNGVEIAGIVLGSIGLTGSVVAMIMQVVQGKQGGG